jgi:hypothetical protein
VTYYCQQESINIELAIWQQYIVPYQIGTDPADEANWLCSLNQTDLVPPQFATVPLSSGDYVHFYSSSSTYPDWDVNEDGYINAADIGRIVLHWGETGTAGWIREDVNNDGYVNAADIGVVVLHWGE